MNILPFAIGIALGGTALVVVTVLKNKEEALTKDGVGVTKFLMSLGYSKANASGIAGNLYAESKFDPTIVGDNGTSFGLAQWHNDRWNKLNEFSVLKGLNANTIEAQLLYLDHELKNTEKNAHIELLKTNTPYNSAYAFAKYFERPAIINAERMEKAIEFHNNI
jgi:hypothetical protein